MENLCEVIESILFVAGEPVELFEIANKLNIEKEEINKAIQTLKEKRKDSGIQVLIFNNKAQLCSNPANAIHVTEVLNPIKERALTKAVLETAAIIAYKQPITRLEVENIRGVNSDYPINMLIDNNLIEVVGRKDAIGKPILFGTTDKFLKKFSLENINELPDYEQLLERIKIIKTEKDSSLFDFREIKEDEVDNKLERSTFINDSSIDYESIQNTNKRAANLNKSIEKLFSELSPNKNEDKAI